MNVFSYKFNLNDENKLKSFLSNYDVVFESQQYAIFAAKCSKFKAVFYQSGKFVVQGRDIHCIVHELIKEFRIENLSFISQDSSSENKKKISDKSSISNMNYNAYIGVDESGKGDFFGPLVIAGVCVNNDNKKLFIDMGIKDSKKISDKTIKDMSLEIQKRSIWSIVMITPSKYNELYLKFKNLNKLLAWGHARVIENILNKYPCEYALSDKFADESLIKNALMKNGKNIILEQKIKAESDIAVACASVLARNAFVEKIESLSSFYGINFPKGASRLTLEAGREFIKTYNKNDLKNVAKIHFKTYNEL